MLIKNCLKKLKFRSHIDSIWVFILFILFLSSCSEHFMAVVEVKEECENAQKNIIPKRPPVDILFIVDNSKSMLEEQENLASNFSCAFDDTNDQFECNANNDDLCALDEEGNLVNRDKLGFIEVVACSANNFQIGIITTDASFNDNKPGELVAATGNDKILTSLHLAANRADFIKQFQENVMVGTNGSNFEKGLESAQIALCRNPEDCPSDLLCEPQSDDDNSCYSGDQIPSVNASSPNSAFVRNGFGYAGFQMSDGSKMQDDNKAILALIFVSDEDDCSHNGNLPEQNLKECYEDYDKLTKVSDFKDFFERIKGVNQGYEGYVRIASIVGALESTTEPGKMESKDCVPGSDGNPVPPTLGECAPNENGACAGGRYIKLSNDFEEFGYVDSICKSSFRETLLDIGDFIVIKNRYNLDSIPDCDDTNCCGEVVVEIIDKDDNKRVVERCPSQCGSNVSGLFDEPENGCYVFTPIQSGQKATITLTKKAMPGVGDELKVYYLTEEC